MKCTHADIWKKKQIDKQRRIKFLGWSFLLVALAFGIFAYLTATDTIREYLMVDGDEQEGYYMLSGLLAVMGLFCLNSIKNPI